MYDDDTLLFLTDDEPLDHVCHIDCVPNTRDGKAIHMMYASATRIARTRRQARALGQQDTRTNREWSYGRKLWREADERTQSGMNPARSDAIYRASANEVFGPDRRPYASRGIRLRARAQREVQRADALLQTIFATLYLPGSEHDPNL